MMPQIRNNTKGFTLIEVLVVIAILGILSAIAISNFIKYRDKAYCSATERDSNLIVGVLASYFAQPANHGASRPSLVATGHVTNTLTNFNTWDVDTSNVQRIVIKVTDSTSRCPQDYRNALNPVASPTGYWTGNSYVKILGQ